MDLEDIRNSQEETREWANNYFGSFYEREEAVRKALSGEDED